MFLTNDFMQWNQTLQSTLKSKFPKMAKMLTPQNKTTPADKNGLFSIRIMNELRMFLFKFENKIFKKNYCT